MKKGPYKGSREITHRTLPPVPNPTPSSNPYPKPYPNHYSPNSKQYLGGNCLGVIVIDLFSSMTNVSQIYGCFFPPDLVTSHFINLYLESTLHTLVVATSDKHGTFFQVVRNNLCNDGIGLHKISERVYYPHLLPFREPCLFDKEA